MTEELNDALAALRDADLVVPVPPVDPLTWATVSVSGRTWLPAFTSASLVPEPTRPIAFRQLAAFWPDPRWGLAVDPGLPTQLLLEAATVVRLAREPVGSGLLQKVVSFEQVTAYLAGEELDLSGFAHQADDADLPETPGALLDALGLPAADGGVYLLRWFSVYPELYRIPYGGTDEAGAHEMAGWVVEPPPFRGTGFVPGPALVIREYKVDGLLPPHGSEIYHLPEDGPERRIAVFDADQRRWLMVRRV
ncbi:SseB family protein [Cryptosporangium sp. NPDC048952]|uniref:SseB family protein n=1 Tax=Cryptosporangium sp. NPDC048952 TaxID=3363961 RepID=UPI003723A204